MTIPKKKQKDYPVPGKEGSFYKSQLDVPNASSYDWDNFIGACEDMGITTELVKNG